ncbi:GntR family transcriptional regulator [Microbacterium aureliae]
MPRKSLVTEVADALLDRIIGGDLEAGSALPSEAEIGATYDVSRSRRCSASPASRRRASCGRSRRRRPDA